MGMATQPASSNTLFAMILLLPHAAYGGSDFLFYPRITSSVDYSDNITLASDDKTDSAVVQFIPGFSLNNSGQHGRVEADYEFQGILYETDLIDDRHHHYLDAYADYQIFPDRFTLFADIKIEPSSVDIFDSALIDTVTGGDQIDDVYRYRGGFEWQQPIKNEAELTFGASLSRVEYQDEDEDLNSQGSDWLIQGESPADQQDSYWKLDYQGSYRENNDDSDNTLQSFAGQAGFAIHNQWDLLINSYGEEDVLHASNGARERSSSANAGPGIRWRPSDHTSIALSYNFALTDSSDDYWGGDISWQPTARTNLSAVYRKRFFGDTYEVSASHRHRKWITQLTYKESESSFSREIFRTETSLLRCPLESLDQLTQCQIHDGSPLEPDERLVQVTQYVGSQNNDLYLLRRGDWSLSRVTTRSNASIGLFWSNREYLYSDNQLDEQDYGGQLSCLYQLNRKISLAFQAEYRHIIDDLELSELTADEQKYNMSLTHVTSRYLTNSFYYQYRQRDSDSSATDYVENRIGATLSYRF